MPSVMIAPGLKGLVSELDLIGKEGSCYSVLPYSSPFGPGVIVKVEDESAGYFLELALTATGFSLTRNGTRAFVPLPDPEDRRGHLILTSVWSTTSLSLTIHDAGGNRKDTIATPPTLPPSTLRIWARRQSLLPIIEYSSKPAVLHEVLNQLAGIAEKLRNTNAVDGFWDTQRDGNKITGRLPKRETEIHPQIRLLLDDLELTRGLVISPEHPIGGGNLDFLITGRVEGGATVSVCLEFKRAHATDLPHGVLVQLPECMDRKRTDFGIFVVLDFGAKYPPVWSGLKNTNGLDDFPNDLSVLLPLLASSTNKKYLRTQILPLYPAVPPSKK